MTAMLVRARRMVALAPLLALAVALLPRPAPLARAQDSPNPTTVTIPGSIQSKLGCDGDWQPTCDKTFLTYDSAAEIWEGVFDLPAGDYEYKVALNQSWDENYGLNAKRNGPNIPLKLSQPTSVIFRYDHRTHWVADSASSPFATVIGTFQQAIGCAADSAPGCRASWLQDPDGDGSFALVTTKIPAGSYAAQVAIGATLDELYGEAGAKGGPAIPFTVQKSGDEIFFGYDAASHMLTISTEGAPKGDLRKAKAHWVDRNTISWDVIGAPKYSYSLFYDPDAKLELRPSGIVGGREIKLAYTKSGPGEQALRRFPHLGSYTALKLPPNAAALLPEMLKSQLTVAVRDEQGKLIDASGVQIAGALDDLYSYAGPLGATIEGGVPTIRLWAPTARAVTLHLFNDSVDTANTTITMEEDPRSGVWSVAGTPDWIGKYYLYEIDVYAAAQGTIAKTLTTDPYSLSLAANSARTQIVDLNDPTLKPAGWDTLAKPPLAAPTDIVLYELHIRDFSSFDASVPEADRGTYKAFTYRDSNGMRHLKALAEAGLTHVHLLPAFDIASIEEDRSRRAEPDAAALAALPPDSEIQQQEITPLRDRDGFNWGYDPFHYTVPEGSYASVPVGTTRIREFREMVQALNSIGLRVVMDMVYNHTSASGLEPNSVFDKIVPGYYHRLNKDGAVENSTCCHNTASEHAMMERLMIDSLRTWATAYKIDGFRFDLMGHHMAENMANVRTALDTLTLERDGVDGKAIYLYGEGWNFGEVANNARGKNATQLNMAGSGIGTFNDRLRDAVRGGGPFSGLQEQGFATGLLNAPNGTDQGSPEDQRRTLLKYSDWIKLGLAGNLKDYTLIDQTGASKAGDQLLYNGQPAGYTLDPHEQIVYISAHDNETLFDAIQLKAAPAASSAERARMATLGLSLVLLSQGVPFIHAGDEILRSKSLDRNSYNSGDWFNRLDWTYQANNWGVGLPSQGDNLANWPIMRPLLANPALKPTPEEIQGALARTLDLLKIRKSSQLFRMRSGAEVRQQLSFLNNGPDQLPGLIVMRLQSDQTSQADTFSQAVVLFNGAGTTQVFTDTQLVGSQLTLHPVQAASADPVVKTASFDTASGAFQVPAYTAAVFVGPPVQVRPTATPVPTATPPPTATPRPTATPVPSATPPPTVAPTAAPTPAPPSSGGSAGLLIGVLGVLAVAGGAAGYLWMRRRK